MRKHIIELCLNECRGWFNVVRPLNPNIIYDSDVLDTVPEAGSEDLTFSEREMVIYLLNREFKWPIPLEHPEAYYVDCDMINNQMGDINKTAVDGLIKDIQNEIYEFQAESLGEEKYIILKLEELIKLLRHNWKVHLEMEKGIKDQLEMEGELNHE